MNTESTLEPKIKNHSGCCCSGKKPAALNEVSKFQTNTNYPVLKFNVEGAQCGGCVNTIEKTLQSIPGVIDARMDLKTNTALVAGPVSASVVTEALNKRGFKTSLVA